MPGASNYVAKLSADVLSTENLESLGHIFDFATLPVRLQGRFIRQGLPLRHRQQCRVVCVHPSCPPLPSSVSSSCVEGRCAFEHHRSSGLHRFTPGPSLQPGFALQVFIAYLAPSAPLAISLHFPCLAGYMWRLCCAAAIHSARPRPMTTGSRLSRANLSCHATLYDPGEIGTAVFQSRGPTWPLPTRTEARLSQVTCDPLPAGEVLRGFLVHFCCGLSSCSPPVRI